MASHSGYSPSGVFTFWVLRGALDIGERNDAKGDNSTDNQIFEIDLQPSMAEMAPDPIDSGLGFPLPRRMVSRSRFNS